jgi:bifunctional DNA-binding transcriptional regulator/antitoxin component of YhaV-PrlF toxin-antitoxin module
MIEITVRQRNQVTIPKAIAEESGIAEGTVCDMQYADGVITIRLPEHRPLIDIMEFAGSLSGVWGSTRRTSTGTSGRLATRSTAT